MLPSWFTVQATRNVCSQDHGDPDLSVLPQMRAKRFGRRETPCLNPSEIHTRETTLAVRRERTSEGSTSEAQALRFHVQLRKLLSPVIVTSLPVSHLIEME